MFGRKRLFDPFEMVEQLSQPNISVYDDEDDFVVTMDVPGFEKEDLDIRLQSDSLQVSADKSDHGRKRSVKKEVKIPEGEVEEENVTAELSNGVLTIRIPMDRETRSGTEIEIE